MLEMGTINGARVAGLAGRVGSLTPGKKADVVLLDARAVNMAAFHDATTAVTLCADVSNVDTVIIDGELRKRGGRLLADVDRARTLVERSRDALIGAVADRRKIDLTDSRTQTPATTS
jgi:cytosine/adenosine deaminase-related metal-dependent hydrolase